MLSFTTLRIAPLAFIQERAVDYPYLGWKLRCVENQKAYLDLQGH